MKKALFCILLAAVALTACNGKGKGADSILAVDTLTDNVDTLQMEKRTAAKYYKLETGEEMFGTVVDCRSYDIMWPTGDHPILQQALLNILFGNETTDFDKAAQKFLKSTDLYGLTDDKPIEITDGSNNNVNNFCHKEMECLTSAPMYVFLISEATYGFGAAHPLSNLQYVNYDIREDRIVTLTDLMDTTHLADAVRKAAATLPENADILDCLFDIKNVYASDNVCIDLENAQLVMQYNIYEIGPYACGTINIRLPIAWLAHHVRLTDYCKQLFDLPQAV